MILSLPFPPTGNHAVKHGGGKHYSTQAAKAYRVAVNAQVLAQNAASAICEPLAVICEVFPPDNRRRDLDNTWKTLADALTHANVWKDDSQIVDLRLVRGEVRPGGMVVVTVTKV
jgi:crossover junction endodeoxyribonuclease RusA